MRRCKIVVVGAGNPLICGCELGADVSQNAVAGCEQGRLWSACRTLCRWAWQPACLAGRAVLFGLATQASRWTRQAALCRCGVAWSVSRWARSAIGISDERISVDVGFALQ